MGFLAKRVVPSFAQDALSSARLAAAERCRRARDEVAEAEMLSVLSSRVSVAVWRGNIDLRRSMKVHRGGKNAVGFD